MHDLQFYDPRTFLVPANYLGTLLHVNPTQGLVDLIIGLFLLFLAAPLERITSTFLGGVYGYTFFAILAMTRHFVFGPTTIAGLVAGALVGFFFPRNAVGLATGALFAIGFAALGSLLGFAEFEEYVLIGGVVISWLLSMVMHHSWTAITCAAAGATMVTLSLPAWLGHSVPLLAVGRVGELIPMYGVLGTLLFFAGSVIQLRLGVLPIGRLIGRRF